MTTFRKKLYKSKKKWVIGLVAGSLLMFGGITTSYADNTSTTAPDQTPLIESDQKPTNLTSINKAKELSNIQANQYNQQNIGYIDPNEEYKTDSTIPKYNNSEKTIYKYDDDAQQEIFNGDGDDILKEYGTPNVYDSNSYGGNYRNVKAESISSIPTSDNVQYHYLNNGVSNAIQIQQDNINAKAINELSQNFSLDDYARLHYIYYEANFPSDFKPDTDFKAFYDNDKMIILYKEGITNKELSSLYEAAYKNRPKITFDKTINNQQITSLLQTSITGSDINWHLNFDLGWQGWTFKNGKQLNITDILRPETKDFNWMNTVTRYIAQSLARKNNESLTFIDRNTKLPITKTQEVRNNGNTNFVFLADGVYVIVNLAIGYNPVLIQLPMAFLRPEYQAYYGKNESLLDPKSNESNEVDLNQENRDYIKNNADNYEKVSYISNVGEKATKDSRIGFANTLISATNDFKQVVHFFINEQSVLMGGITGFKKFITDLSTNPAILHFISDIHSFLDALPKEKAPTDVLPKEKAPAVLHLGLAGVVGDEFELANSMKQRDKENKVKRSQLVSENKKSFKKARKAELNVISNAINLFKSFSETISDFLDSNPIAKVLVLTVLGVIALIGTPVLAVLIYTSTGIDDELLSKFHLKRKK